MKTLKTINDVFIRSKKPERNKDNLKGIIYKGFEVTVKDKEIQGKPGEDNNPNTKWYEDLNGDYLWSGGFEKEVGVVDDFYPILEEKIPKDFQKYIFDRFNQNNYRLSKRLNYNTLLDIDIDLKNTKGIGTSIGILDNPIPLSKDFFQSRLEILINGGVIQNTHGIRMASLIGSNNQNINSFGITGVAPLCNLISIPIVINGDHTIENYLNALRKLTLKYKSKFLIINASFEIKKAYLKNEDILHFFKTLSSNYIVIACAGQDEELLKRNTIQYPASLKTVISVGTISNQFCKNYSKDDINNDVDILLPEFIYASYNHKEPLIIPSSGDSSATAIVTGITSLICSRYDFIDKCSIVDKILENSIAFSHLQNLKLFKPINPKK